MPTTAHSEGWDLRPWDKRYYQTRDPDQSRCDQKVPRSSPLMPVDTKITAALATLFGNHSTMRN